MKREELFDKIRNLKDKSYSVGWIEMFTSTECDELEGVINNFLDTYHEELEAKVYVYEKIIANSNFAPMFQMKPVESKPTTKEILDALRIIIDGKTFNDTVPVHVIETLIETIEEKQRPF